MINPAATSVAEDRNVVACEPHPVSCVSLITWPNPDHGLGQV